MGLLNAAFSHHLAGLRLQDFKNSGHEFIPRAQAGYEAILFTVKSHISIHGNELADKLANEAEDECYMRRHFDYDLSNVYTQQFKDNFW